MIPFATIDLVLARYPAFLRGSLHPLDPTNSFSGAAIWRIDTSVGNFCLKAWPSADITAERLAWIHGLMRLARQAGLAFVPDVIPARDGATSVAEAGRLWDITTWMPGQADFHARPTPIRLAAACTALARLHLAWGRTDASHAPCPAVARRLALHADWLRLVRAGWRPAYTPDDPASSAAAQAWRLLATHIDAVPSLLAGWRERPLPLQPCLGDIWHAHVLFDGDEVVGLIDYGSARVDHVASDLARLLGSLAGDHTDLRAGGFRAYRTARPLSREEEALADLLDRTGTILALANWLMMLFGAAETTSERIAFSRQHRAEAGRRLADLVARVETW